MRLFFLALLSLVISVQIGCSGSSEAVKTAKVSGKVTLDDNPLTEGKINFDAQNGMPPALLDILDGQYEGYAPIGKVKVSLTSTKQTTWKEVTGKSDGPGYDEVTEIDILPERYKNISREVKEGENTFNFELKSK